jgi:hypothetical protein
MLGTVFLTALLSTRALSTLPGEAHERMEVGEPMVFDLVRGLGAKRGEFEVNTLLRYTVVGPHLHWAPEIEWAFADGMAVELELPLVGQQLQEVKLAGQFTLPRHHRRFIDGIQTIIEISVAGHPSRFTDLYVAGVHIDRLSLLAMIGPRIDMLPAHGIPLSHVVNFAAFLELDSRAAVGIELDSVLGSSVELMAMPQVDLQAHRNVRVQTGVGVGFSSHTGASVMFGIRLIAE